MRFANDQPLDGPEGRLEGGHGSGLKLLGG